MAKKKNLKSPSPFYYDQIMDNPELTVRIISDKGVVLKGIYKDDFHLGIQNQWQSGGSSMIKMVVDSVASFVTGRDSKMWAGLASAGIEMVRDNVQDEDAKKFVNAADDLVKGWEKYSNAHIFSADDYFKSFKGTSTTFPTSLHVTLITDSDSRDIYSDIQSIINISVGEFESFAGFVGIQHAPNGFRSTFANIDTNIEGTVRVVFGNTSRGGFQIDNVVISNVGVQFSKVKVNTKYGWRPLYADVQVMFEPARMMTKTDVLKSMGLTPPTNETP